jgi:hypothetical protein
VPEQKDVIADIRSIAMLEVESTAAEVPLQMKGLHVPQAFQPMVETALVPRSEAKVPFSRPDYACLITMSTGVVGICHWSINSRPFKYSMCIQ